MSEPVSRNNNGSSGINVPEKTAAMPTNAQAPRAPQAQAGAPKPPNRMPISAPISAPPGQPTSAYKPVNPRVDTEQQAKRPAKKGGNKLLIFGIIVCLLAVAALVCAVLFVMNQPSNTTTQQTAVNAPSNSQITKALEDADLKAPDISSYKYVSADDLTGPTFSDISTAQGNSTNVCNVTAKATFKNTSVMIEQPVALRFTQKDNDWVGGSVTTSPADVTPTGAPDIQALTKDIPTLLEAYDESVASQFKNPDIVADSKGLSAQGGTAKFTLEKTEGSTTKQCAVNVKLAWKNDSGWDPQIESVGNITTGSNSQNAADDPANGGDEDEDPDALLQCSSGDLVQIPGIIDYVNDRFLLRADNYIRVEMDGKVFNVHYFELQSNTMQFTVGSHVEVTGVISETGALRQAPLVITLN